MTAQDNKALTRRMFEEYNAISGDPSRASAWVDRTYSPGIVFHAPLSGNMNFEQLKQFHVAELAIDPKFTVKSVVVEEDMAVAQFTLTATHQGAFMGLPATGKKFQVEGNMVMKLKGNKCEEIWFYLDTLGFMRGLGAIPAPLAPAK